ncbi:GTPase ObgE [bacterium]|nr:GTPase ObgE [bacterium]MBP9809638.1 GTPase ObgE [bacterium]
MSQLIDQVEIEVLSGDGGNGAVMWRKEKYEPMGGPYGGNGGRGGSVYLEATNDLSTLVDFRFKQKFEAQPGAKGANKNCHGKAGNDITIRVPVGTVVRDLNTDRVIADLITDKQRVMVAEGGYGGKGNCELATPTKRAPHYCEPGQPGIARRLQLTLKLLADVGIIGMPNAGKSTLLAAATRAKPKIADYPFTTLEPNLGVVKPERGPGFVMADIPGLIEGASQGIGLGHSFLRHVERTRLLIHMVDITSENPLADLQTINNELALYDKDLSSLPQLVVLNKSEMMLEEEALAIKEKVAAALSAQKQKNVYEDDLKLKESVFLMSAYSRVGVPELLELTGKLVTRLKELAAAEEPASIEEDEAAVDHGSTGFEVIKIKGGLLVESDRVDRIIQVTNLKEPESLFSLWQRLRAMGVIDALIEAGAEPGTDVTVGGIIFTFGEGMQ